MFAATVSKKKESTSQLPINARACRKTTQRKGAS